MHPNHPLVPATWLETDTADGAIAATAGDMAIYARMLLNRGAYPGGRIYPETLFERKISAGKMNEDGYSYGYGIIAREIDGHAYVGHPGGMVGYAAGMVASLDAGIAAVAFVNGPGSPYLLARYAVALVRAAKEGSPLPSPPDTSSGDLATISGTFYRDGDETSEPLIFAPEGDVIVLHHRGESIPLHLYDDEAFLSDHPDWDRFILRFERDSNDKLIVMTHGGDWFAVAGSVPPPIASLPARVGRIHRPLPLPQPLGLEFPGRPPPRRTPPDLPRRPRRLRRRPTAHSDPRHRPLPRWRRPRRPRTDLLWHNHRWQSPSSMALRRPVRPGLHAVANMSLR